MRPAAGAARGPRPARAARLALAALLAAGAGFAPALARAEAG